MFVPDFTIIVLRVFTYSLFLLYVVLLLVARPLNKWK